jgi:hypothetical protein
MLATMLALALAFSLFAATVDPRLAEPLRLLAELEARDASGQAIGPHYAHLPGTLRLTLAVRALPPRSGGHYDPRRRIVTMGEALMSEDPRVLAAVLVHELHHASDFDLIAVGLLERDCVELEARAFEAQAIVTRVFWPDELPSGTDWEKGLAMNVTTYESGGIDGLRSWVAQTAGYRRECRSRAWRI